MYTFEGKPFDEQILTGGYLAGKNILITGGTKGIGYAIAKSCLINGANVVVTGRNDETANQAADSLKTANINNIAQGAEFDILNIENIKLNFEKIINIMPNNRIDILVNNAGVLSGNSIGDTSLEDYDLVLNTNLRGTYFLSQYFSRYLIENHIKGNILMVSSSSSNRPAISPYTLSKWGVLGLTKGLAKKLIKYDIVVNGVAPGPTVGGMLKIDNELSFSSSPAKRYTTPQEVANIAVMLMSDMGRMIVGETIFITGGCGTLTFEDMSY